MDIMYYVIWHRYISSIQVIKRLSVLLDMFCP